MNQNQHYEMAPSWTSTGIVYGLWMIIQGLFLLLWSSLLTLSHSAVFGLAVGVAVWHESGPVTGLAVALSLITRKDLGLFVSDFYNEVWERAAMDKIREAKLSMLIRSITNSAKSL